MNKTQVKTVLRNATGNLATVGGDWIIATNAGVRWETGDDEVVTQLETVRKYVGAEGAVFPAVESSYAPERVVTDINDGVHLSWGKLYDIMTNSAASNDEVRPILCSIFVDNGNLVSCDSYRLLIVPAPYGFEKLDQTLLPVVKLPKPLKSQNDDAVSIVVDGDKVVYRHDDWYIVHSIAIGDYPDYQKLSPTNCINTAELDMAKVSEFVKNCVRSSNTPVVLTDGVTVSYDDAIVKLTPTNVGDGEIAEGKIAFNPLYLAFFRVLGDKVTIETQSQLHAAKLSSDRGVGLLMPIRT